MWTLAQLRCVSSFGVSLYVWSQYLLWRSSDGSESLHIDTTRGEMRCVIMSNLSRACKHTPYASQNMIIVMLWFVFMWLAQCVEIHYDDAIMGAIGSQITSLTIVYSTVYSGADQSKHQSSASLAFVWGIHRGPVNSPHKWPVTRKMFPFDDVIMNAGGYGLTHWGQVIHICASGPENHWFR